MVLLSFIRVIKFSFKDIYRNIWLSIVTVIILILALFSINLLLTVRVISQTAINAVKDKIDVSLYLKPDSTEGEIAALRGQISNLAQVKEVDYVSKAQALEFFQEKNRNNPEILQALRELGKNPLTPSLVITPKSAEVAADLIGELNKIESELIESRDFSDHKLLLDKINGITDRVSEVGFTISLIFIFSTLLVVYNAIRVEIYTHREEIAIMRLVGASNSFVHMPFMLSSLIYTLIGTAAVILIFYPFLSLLQPYLETFFVGYNVNIISYFNENFIKIFGLQFLIVAVINALASLLAVRKYARV
ncbi:MAG: ABC transporter permease [Patescibacteria group bacterium]|nr:ABC transporter permease [Patescibacteria group bacterium]